MITFTTETGSVYQLDQAQMWVRRMTGTHPPTANQRTDGDWQHYAAAGVPPLDLFTLLEEDTPALASLTPIAGERFLIIWGWDYGDGGQRTRLRRTITSQVTEVKEQE